MSTAVSTMTLIKIENEKKTPIKMLRYLTSKREIKLAVLSHNISVGELNEKRYPNIDLTAEKKICCCRSNETENNERVEPSWAKPTKNPENFNVNGTFFTREKKNWWHFIMQRQRGRLSHDVKKVAGDTLSRYETRMNESLLNTNFHPIFHFHSQPHKKKHRGW